MADPDSKFQSFQASFAWNSSDKVLYNLRSLMAVLDAVVLPLRGSKASFDDAVLNFRSILTDRFATDIQPLFDAITADASLGSIFMTTSVTPVQAGLGSKAFDIDFSDRLKYAAPAYLAAVSKSDPTIAMLGTFGGFDRENGIVLIQVDSVSKPGATADDWNIIATPPPYVPLGLNAGSYDGSAPTAGIPFVSSTSTGGGISGGAY